MQEYYTDRAYGAWARPHGQIPQVVYPYYDDYEERLAHGLQRRLSKAYRSGHIGVEEESDEESDLEKATRKHIAATEELDQARKQSDEAKRKLEDCESRVRAATDKLEKAKKELRRHRYAYR
jgi:chromosome segregation ATPase